MSSLENHGVIIRHLRQRKELSLRKCSNIINKSIGWLSEVENASGNSKLTEEEFDRIVSTLGGDKDRAMFKTWVAKHKNKDNGDKTFDGAVLRYIRKKKGISLVDASASTGLSIGYLSKLETGLKAMTLELRNLIMQAYGYRPSSFKNLSKDPKRSKAVPIEYKLNILLKKMSEDEIKDIFNTISSNHLTTQTGGQNV